MKMMKMEMELDRISKLPDGVTEKILSLLSLREAVRTSVLSTKWRCKWDKLQALVFDDEYLSTQSHPTSSFVNMVDHVLLLHSGPIYKFKLSTKHKLATRDLDRWILLLSKKHVVKVVILEIRKGNVHNIPSCLFSCQDIVYLKLFRCLLNPPPTTCKGFRSLKTLCFHKVTMAQDVFEKLISCSSLLERLMLMNCDGFTNVKIDAPKLRFIYIDGVFQDFNLMNSSNLVHASFKMQFNVVLRPGSSGKLIKFFNDHPHIHMFSINRYFLKYLSIGVLPLPEKLPKPCQYLNILSLGISFDDPDEISTVLCLLRSSPALQELHILLSLFHGKLRTSAVDLENDQAAVKEVKSCLYDNYNWAHTQLRLVKITKISYAKAQLDFIKFLLLSSPVLERMIVQPSSADGFSNLVKELLLFKRDSKSAEIVVLDP